MLGSQGEAPFWIAYRNVRNQKTLKHLVENADKLASSVLSMICLQALRYIFKQLQYLAFSN